MAELVIELSEVLERIAMLLLESSLGTITGDLSLDTLLILRVR